MNETTYCLAATVGWPDAVVMLGFFAMMAVVVYIIGKSGQ